ncbi:MAG: protein phosphatase 2C domain-containing protein [Alphaproteobacteria bacterium]|nr:protein phosphatase 2C domain-containing protein [Alphaproteobacteria bacterium]
MSARPIEFTQGSFECLGQRSRQEDFCAVWSPDNSSLNQAEKPLLVVLADGMGGQVCGHTASRLACNCYIQSFSRNDGEIGPRMARALEVSNRSIADAIAMDPALQGMGCTLVGAYFDQDGLRWVSVGDSTLLLYRAGSLRRMNADHSHGAILDRQAAAGMITAQTAISDTRRTALYSALTGGPIQMRDLELNPHSLYQGDWIIVASDGLLTLEGDEIAELIGRNLDETPQAVTRLLIHEVDKRNKPRQDNTTVLAVKITGRQVRLSEALGDEGRQATFVKLLS